MRGGETSPSSATTAAEAAAGETPKAGDAAPAEPSEAAPRPSVGTAGEEGAEEDPAQCPICQFIEAGECKVEHQTWVACRTEAKAAGKDYIEECQDHFKAFLQCAVDHRDYYEPFLEMLGGLPEDDEQADGGAPPQAPQGEGEKQQQEQQQQ